MSGAEQPKPSQALEKIQKVEEQEKAKEVALKAEETAAKASADSAPEKRVEAAAEAKKEERKPDSVKKEAAKKESAKKDSKKEGTKKEESEKEEKKRVIVLERNYVIPLIKAYARPECKRGNRAIKLIRGFLARHFKASEDKVKLNSVICEAVFARGSTHPPKKIKVKASKDKEGLVLAELVP